MSEATVVWNGPDDLRERLVAISELEPFPNNPRRGNTGAVAESLRRFGQVKPVVVDGRRIVAGHTLVRAAESEGWTHVSFTENAFGSEEEQRAYLLADNRSSDLGTYDDRLLRDQLRALSDTEGTGYAEADLMLLEARLRAQDPPSEFPPLDPDDLEVQYRCPSCLYEWSGSPRPGVGDADD